MPKKPSKTQPAWYTLKALGNDEAELSIYDVIGGTWWDSGITGKQFAQDLKALPKHSTLNIYINSPGGSVYDGQLIYSVLARHKTHKKVFIDGLAASMASVIAMVGDEIIMPENAMMMIHDPLTAIYGNAADLRERADWLDKYKLTAVSAYRNKTGLDDQEISDLMSAETWMTAQEAIDKGFADTMSDAVDIAALSHFDLSMYHNAPSDLKKKRGHVTNIQEQFSAALQTQNAHVPHITSTGESTVPKDNDAPAISRDYILANHPDIANAFRDEGKKEGFLNGKKEGLNEGTHGEHARLSAIDAAFEGFPHLSDLKAELKADPSASEATANARIVAAERDKADTFAKNLKADGNKAAQATATNAHQGEENEGGHLSATPATLEDAEKIYNSDESVRAVYSSASNYYYARKHTDH